MAQELPQFCEILLNLPKLKSLRESCSSSDPFLSLKSIHQFQLTPLIVHVDTQSTSPEYQAFNVQTRRGEGEVPVSSTEQGANQHSDLTKSQRCGTFGGGGGGASEKHQGKGKSTLSRNKISEM